MSQKKIKITIDESNNIIVKNNDEIKITIKNDNKVITGADILKSLNLEKGDEVEVLPLEESLNVYENYKVAKIIYELYEKIIDGIRSYSEDYDIDVEDKDIDVENA